MQKRFFGFETEYSVAVRTRMGTISSDALPQAFLRPVIMRADDAPSLAELGIVSMTAPRNGVEALPHPTYWLGSNGAKFYFESVGGRLPEYSTPECQSVMRAVICARAGDVILERIRREYMAQGAPSSYADVFISKGNTVFTDASLARETHYTGSHENYYISDQLAKRGTWIPLRDPRDKEFWECIDFLIPFFVSRVVLHGQGGIRYDPAFGWHYCISQKAQSAMFDYSESTVGTTRGIIKFQDRSDDCPEGYARLQPVYADSNMSPLSSFLRLGTTHLVLRAREEYGAQAPVILAVPGPQALKSISRDLTLKEPVPLLGGHTYTAIEIQRSYLDMVLRTIRNFSPEEEEIISRWGDALDRLDHNPESMSRELDWVIKLSFLNASGLAFASPKARFADFLYAEISDRGIYNRLRRENAVTSCIEGEEELIAEAIRSPEADTRSCIRSRFISALRQYKPGSWMVDWGVLMANGRQVKIRPEEIHNGEVDGLIDAMRRERSK
ncbi:MAG: hypothetical protein A3I44_01840 [Candidatus Sungbacteria bacterium RIFCSPLOWO2_02_FULL_51_17]|uniref:Pup--protein ligase n=1 Tax=Candidatus Sungbacteria bacterium RIFCSPHIGHO2_02_FULL_51_29 TaxID=1802273 RepID=A0A1G2KV51_9BACT|nr:MAG: hypothetical protein A3C16_01405 [Candidatus Sungbacteria bacterium RIFCSPHIGHO2_02_FULL_51_29]OHA10915.1 MAG: hypothetical protein A3I44_01840 [Candidatus Sungbacteria bacterium RIFCSPLOWO2_02_FULL_51_17]